MFSVEIKLNGSMIVHVYGRNVTDPVALADEQYRRIAGGSDDSEELPNEYEFEYYETSTRQLVCGHVQHCRSKGIRPLLMAILEEVRKAEEEQQHGEEEAGG